MTDVRALLGEDRQSQQGRPRTKLEPTFERNAAALSLAARPITLPKRGANDPLADVPIRNVQSAGDALERTLNARDNKPLRAVLSLVARGVMPARAPYPLGAVT